MTPSLPASTFQPAGLGVGSDDVACCAPNHEGHYWGKTFDLEDLGPDNQPHFLCFDPLLNQQLLRSQIANHYLATTTPAHWDFAIDDLGDYTVPFDFGHLVGSIVVDPNCKLDGKIAESAFSVPTFGLPSIQLTFRQPLH
ncbi:MAG: hypothetical protein AAFZ52_06510 [Bacteroidota bacterium]